MNPGAEKAFKIPWQGTYTHVTIKSDIPVTIFIEDDSDTVIYSSNFSIDKIFSPGGMFTVINNNSHSTTVEVQLARAVVFK